MKEVGFKRGVKERGVIDEQSGESTLNRERNDRHRYR